MAAINPNFAAKLFELTAIAYRDGITCPPLLELNNWALPQLLDGGILTNSGTIRTAANDGAGGANFEDAVLAAIASSPNGVTARDIQPIIAHLRQPASYVGTALGRLMKAGKAEKRGDLWFAADATRGGKISRKLTAGTKRTRSARNVQPTAEQQPQAATG